MRWTEKFTMKKMKKRDKIGVGIALGVAIGAGTQQIGVGVAIAVALLAAFGVFNRSWLFKISILKSCKSKSVSPIQKSLI